ncbi:short chain dehydrogenase [Kocuria rhizosphaericola]|uniref:short chain dehydrogenase n=1 Tax=Kocuria rhizosphaericola TaxID=3376284 RepID=UPI0037A48CDA
MKKVLVVGATGLIGQTVADTLAQEHEVVHSSRNDGERADMSDPASVRALFERVGPVDAVVSCAGAVPFKPLTELAAADYEAAVQEKVLGQVNLVTEGLAHVRDGGSFTLISGVLSREPIATGAAASLANGAVESFVMAAATELPRGIRINVVSPSVLAEAEAYHPFFPGYPQVPAAEVARAYVRSVDGVETGKTFDV